MEILKYASSECCENKFKNNETLRREKLRKDWAKPVSYLQREEELQVKNIARRFLLVVRRGYQLGESEGKFTPNHSFIHSKIPSDAGPFGAWGRMAKPQAKWSRRETLSLVTHFGAQYFARALLMEPLTNGPFWHTAFVSHFRPCDVLMGIFSSTFSISYANICTCIR